MWIASSSERSSLYLSHRQRLHREWFWPRVQCGRTYRFSRKVLPLTMFLPMALAFQAQYDPDGSTWYRDWPLCASQPAISSEIPYGRTPLRTSAKSLRQAPRAGTYPDWVAFCMTAATSWTRIFVGGYSPYTFQ